MILSQSQSLICYPTSFKLVQARSIHRTHPLLRLHAMRHEMHFICFWLTGEEPSVAPSGYGLSRDAAQSPSIVVGVLTTADYRLWGG